LSAPDIGTGPGVRTATTGDDGSFELIGAAPGNLLLVAEEPSIGRSSVARAMVMDGDTVVNLQLQAPGSLSGHVSHAGQPIATSRVPATRSTAGLGVSPANWGPDGASPFDSPAADTYPVSARAGAPGRSSMQSGSVTVSSGQAAVLDLDVPAGSVTVVAGVTGP